MTFPADQVTRIRHYLQAGTADASIEDIITRVEEGVAELASAALSFSQSSFTAKCGEQEWTPAETLNHVISWNMTCARQVLWVALGGELPAAQAETLPTGREELLAVHREALDSLYAHVREADPTTFLDITWQHPFFGELNWHEWLLFIRLHSLDHARQLASMRNE